MPDAPHVFHWQELGWDDPLSALDPAKRPPKELVEKARKGGANRKKIVRGEGGFYMNRSVMAAGFRVPTHHHDQHTAECAEQAIREHRGLDSRSEDRVDQA